MLEMELEMVVRRYQETEEVTGERKMQKKTYGEGARYKIKSCWEGESLRVNMWVAGTMAT